MAQPSPADILPDTLFTSRLLVLLIPIIGVRCPLFRLLPALFGWSMRHRVYRLYGELKFLEAVFNAAQPGDKAAIYSGNSTDWSNAPTGCAYRRRTRICSTP